MIPIQKIIELVQSKFAEFRATDFSEVQFGSGAWAIGIGGFILSVLILKLLFYRLKPRPARAHSGHEVPKGFPERYITKVARLFPKIVVAAGVVFVLLALAEPYLPRTNEEEFVESRERIDLLDNSTSMMEFFSNTGKMKAAVAREAHLSFLKMRRGQRDRTSLWVFSDNPYKISRFIVDDNVYRFQVEDAPYVLTQANGCGAYDVSYRRFCREIGSEGGTQMNRALQAAIEYFETEGNPAIKRKTLLIMTDAEAASYPAEEFKEMRRKNIVPYMILIYNPPYEEEYESDRYDDASTRTIAQQPQVQPGSIADQVLQAVRALGGEYYPAQDRDAVQRAFKDINRTERATTRVVKYLSFPPIFQRFLFVGVALLMVGCLAGLIEEFLWGQYPN